MYESTRSISKLKAPSGLRPDSFRIQRGITDLWSTSASAAASGTRARRSAIPGRRGTRSRMDAATRARTAPTCSSLSSLQRSASSKRLTRSNVRELCLARDRRVRVSLISPRADGLTDIQEYYANTGALKVAAENASGNKCSVSIVEAFRDDADGPQPKDLDDVLRLEYRSKLLNPRWAEAMLEQGSGGAYEVSSRFTAMVGWGAVNGVDDFVWDGASEKYALDDAVSEQLRRSNPEAYRNVLARLLEAAGRGMWNADEDVLRRLREKYADADDSVEGVA
mmetsp:Transcript_2326/g.6997  ORF Transcript_2326/g.6997 Transcript_2326/m.6997 type:complete len:280 (-) Transcript_2326:64-903(-)